MSGNRMILVVALASLVLGLAAGSLFSTGGQAIAQPTPPAQRWVTGYFNEAHPLQGPILITFLRSNMDPSDSRKQSIVWTGHNSRFSVENFTGQFFLPGGQSLTIAEKDSSREIIYSGYRQ
jgi:hypothetical protein